MKKFIEKIREQMCKENIKKLWMKIWGEEPEPVDESILEDPDRYVTFDEHKDDQYWADQKRYKKEKTLLTMRRIGVTVILIFILVSILESISLFVKTNEFLTCLGKDVCIYLGPKRIHPEFRADKIIGLKNGDAFVLSYTSKEYLVEYYDKAKNRFLNINSERNIASKFYKTRFNTLLKFYFSDPYKLIVNDNEEVVIIDTSSPIEIFDTKNKKFVLTNINFFNFDKIKNKKNIYIYLVPYINNYSLVMSNNSIIGTPSFDAGLNNKISKPEKIYLFNNNDYTLKEMPSFAISLKYFPRPSDIIVLNNGKIILPIRYKYKRTDPQEYGLNYYSNNSKPETDHIEIYDPVLNKFIAETNKDILEDNILHVILDNNDVIFLNKNSTYIFINKDNKFIKANDELTQRNQKTVEKLSKLLIEHMALDIEEIFGVERARVLKLAPQKFLITCDVGHMYPFDNTGNPNNAIKPITQTKLSKSEKFQACRNTVYYNYENNIVKKGPKFLQQHFSAKIAQLTGNLYIVLGGHEITLPPAKPNQRVQFIKVKN